MTKVKGCGPILKASFDGKSKIFFPSLKANQSCAGTKDLVLLSIIGNEYCQGDYLESIVENALATHEVTTFLVADEIYWHNLKLSDNPPPDMVDELKERATALGSDYIEKQLAHFLKPMKIDPKIFNENYKCKTIDEKIAIINDLARDFKFGILRWKDWVAQAPESFKARQHALLDLYSTNVELQKSVHEQAINFARRHTANDLSQFDLFYVRSQGYLQEESLNIIWLSANLQYNFIVYPGEMPKPFAATKDYFINNREMASPEDMMLIQVNNSKLLVNWLEVNFTRRPEQKKTILKPPSTPSVTALPSEAAGARAEGIIALNEINIFFGKPAHQDKNIVEIDPMITEWATIMASVTKTVLESEQPYEFKLQYIEQLVNRLFAEILPINLDINAKP